MSGRILNYVDDEDPTLLHDAFVVGGGADDVIYAYLPSKRMVCELAEWNLSSSANWQYPRFHEHNGMRLLDEIDSDEKARRCFGESLDPIDVWKFARATALMFP